ncbi:sulfopyruvate decarboxylase subunit alpha/phosphonopyruvate decarboxylase [Amycolatopsis arida]|uniref:Sulfopyruvate decarboxylase subunit alpha/phosphonopyruvate decarboxylase n=1 Tax=Amycolatopsis arida TaxID=587909 RepID=A0A1I5QAF6_9PSEU|nr:sulfopyruvate decarboxylase subunit alpha [Amycolatopsis arida]TDX98772.1 sulfopyruvate decarboxylase subunit alpha/phosphonopyruvate decarboxylase [Amycolatopsis arida]SFP43289.1 sulfopyruvate decarboxylase subunit alpha/phosphonopyruvate decarboxylase [Amycolatopsis arida]
MTAVTVDTAGELAAELTRQGFGPFYGTPCGILAKLYSAIEGIWTVPREDNAVGIAAGAALAGRCPVVLMQNSGLGQSVNALASLVVPYRLPMLLVVSLRGVGPDSTQENLVMGRLTEPLLTNMGVPWLTLDPELDVPAQVSWAAALVRDQGRAAALLIPPAAFGWRP